MKKRNCQECNNFLGIESSEIVVVEGKERVKWMIRCSKWGLVETITEGAIPWKMCSKYEPGEEEMKVKSEAKEPLNIEIGCRIKTIRKALGLTQTEIGKESNTSRSVVGLIEHGVLNPNLRFLVSLCLDYKVDGNFLLTGQGKMFRGRR